jgi:hypothetical protein
MKLALLLLHLEPSAIIPVEWVDLAEGFHREIEDPFERRDATGEGLPLQGGDETFARGGWIHTDFDGFHVMPLL